MTPIPLSPFITTNNLLEESVVGPADRQTVAAASPNAPSAAAVTPSSSLEVATTAPGMAHSNSELLEIPAFLKRNADNSFPSDK